MPNNYYQSQEPQAIQAEPPVAVPPAESNSLSEQNTPDITNTANNTDTSDSISTPDNTSTGQLVVSVFTANQLYPVVSANVSVTAENSDEILASGTTDRSGRTTLFSLPAPSASMSQEPTVAAPFTEYRVSITHPDYFEAVIENVQLFGGIVTQLPVNLVPLPELNDDEAARIVIIPRQNL